jgi:small subunit ribosomal protein S17
MVRPAKNIGLEATPPTRTCEDDKCPYHGSVSVRGIVITGKIIKKYMKNAAVIERTTIHYVKKYKRYERRRKRISVHLPPCIDADVGDIVRAAECRPLSKTISFVVVENLSRKGG